MNINLFGEVIIEDEPVELTTKKISPFDYINNIASKKYPDDLSGYNPFITNLAFSQREDLVVMANEVNKYHGLVPEAQFDFYYHVLPKKNLFSKWAKAAKHDDIEAVKEYYGISNKVAMEYLKTLKTSEIQQITHWFATFKGGK